jgi:hypothetical protein
LEEDEEEEEQRLETLRIEEYHRQQSMHQYDETGSSSSSSRSSSSSSGGDIVESVIEDHYHYNQDLRGGAMTEYIEPNVFYHLKVPLSSHHHHQMKSEEEEDDEAPKDRDLIGYYFQTPGEKVIWHVNFDAIAILSPDDDFKTTMATFLLSLNFSNAVETLFDRVPGNYSVYLNNSGFIITVITRRPTSVPTSLPTIVPSPAPTAIPTPVPTYVPTIVPSPQPTITPMPSPLPTPVPTPVPSLPPTSLPTIVPSPLPSPVPTIVPTPPPTRYAIKHGIRIVNKFPKYIRDVPSQSFMITVAVPFLILLIGFCGCVRCITSPVVLIKKKGLHLIPPPPPPFL